MHLGLPVCAVSPQTAPDSHSIQDHRYYTLVPTMARHMKDCTWRSTLAAYNKYASKPNVQWYRNAYLLRISVMRYAPSSH